MGVGQDAGGSVRFPAHACGIAALKETWRRIPTTGMLNVNTFGLTSLVMPVMGPMARYVDDLHLAYSVLAGPDGKDAYASPVPIQNHKKVPLVKQ